MRSIQKIDLVNETSETNFHKAPSNLGLDLGICLRHKFFSLETLLQAGGLHTGENTVQDCPFSWWYRSSLKPISSLAEDSRRAGLQLQVLIHLPNVAVLHPQLTLSLKQKKKKMLLQSFGKKQQLCDLALQGYFSIQRSGSRGLHLKTSFQCSSLGGNTKACSYCLASGRARSWWCPLSIL